MSLLELFDYNTSVWCDIFCIQCPHVSKRWWGHFKVCRMSFSLKHSTTILKCGQLNTRDTVSILINGSQDPTCSGNCTTHSSCSSLLGTCASVQGLCGKVLRGEHCVAWHLLCWTAQTLCNMAYLARLHRTWHASYTLPIGLGWHGLCSMWVCSDPEAILGA